MGARRELESARPDERGENADAHGALGDSMSSLARAAGRAPRPTSPASRGAGAAVPRPRLFRRAALTLALLGAGLAFGWWADGFLTRASRRSVQVPVLAPRLPPSLERLPTAPVPLHRPRRRASAPVEAAPSAPVVSAPAVREPPERRVLRAIVGGEGPAGRIEVRRLLQRPVGQAVLACIMQSAPDDDPEAIADAEVMLAAVERVSFRRNLRVLEGQVTHPALLGRLYGGPTELQPAGREGWVVTRPGLSTPSPSDGSLRVATPAGIIGDTLLVDGSRGFEAESWVEAFEDTPPDPGPLAALEGPSDIALLIGAEDLESMRRDAEPWMQPIIESVERIELRVDATDDVRVEIDLHTPHPRAAVTAIGAALLATRAAGALGPQVPTEVAELLARTELDALDGIARLTTTLSVADVVEFLPECRASRQRGH